LEKIIKTGFVVRKQKHLLPTEKAENLITVLPDALKSPALTAEWEHKLKQIERDEMTADGFIEDIVEMTSTLIHDNNTPLPEYTALFAQPPKGDVIGVCPRCGSSVREGKKGFFCDNRACLFKLWRDAKFFTSKKKEITKAVATALLKDGKTAMQGLFSEKTGKKYDAVVLLNDTGEKYVNFKLSFDNVKRSSKQ
jgi:DNA topoisomerase-3